MLASSVIRVLEVMAEPILYFGFEPERKEEMEVSRKMYKITRSLNAHPSSSGICYATDCIGRLGMRSTHVTWALVEVEIIPDS